MKRLLAILLLATVLTGCVANPVTGSRELVLIEERQEIVIGQEVFAVMQEKEGGRDTKHPEVAAYVESVGKKLAAVSDRPNLPYEFVLLDNPVPNAWTLPGGKIAVNSGLLVNLESEAELAAVLSHEIVHAAGRHGAQQLESGIWLDIATQAGCEALGVESRDLLQLGNALIKLKYSRNKEFEADKYGITYMSRTGYDVNAAVSLQEKFLALAENKNPTWLDGILATHPPSKERIRANKKTAAKLPQGGFVGREIYQQKISSLKKP